MVTMPAKAMTVPVNWRLVGRSFRTTAAMTVPNITSDCTRRMAGVASIIDRPVKLSPYWKVAEISAMTISDRQWPRGSGTNQTSSRAAMAKRIPISSSGGKWPSPALARANPNPHVISTRSAIRRCRGVISPARTFRHRADRGTAALHPWPLR